MQDARRGVPESREPGDALLSEDQDQMATPESERQEVHKDKRHIDDNGKPHLERIPPETVLEIASWLEAKDLARLGAVSQRMRTLIEGADGLWASRALTELGIEANDIDAYSQSGSGDAGANTTATKCRTAFATLYKHRWLRPGVWHGDKPMLGSLLVSTHNAATRSYELYEVLSRQDSGLSRQASPPHANYYAHSISYGAQPLARVGARTDYADARTLMAMCEYRRVAVTLMRVTPLLPERVHPSMSVWPPPVIPAADRARNVSATGFRGHHRPGDPASDTLLRLSTVFSLRTVGIAVPEGVETVARVDDALLAPPTAKFQWRGLWVTNLAYGDEFALFLQDRPSRVEAVKLTGNARVPRGEYAFLVDDLHTRLPSDDVPEYVGRLGLPVVEARFQTADTNFINRRFEQGQLVLFSPNVVLLFTSAGLFVASFTRVNHRSLVAKSCDLVIP